MIHEKSGPAGPRPVQLRLARLKNGESATFRIIEPTITGLYVHWIGSETKGRSQYCHGPTDCRYAHDRLDKLWKGYASADMWDEQNRLWVPVVLELTEACELDMRAVYRPGQQWKLTRTPATRSKREAILARLTKDAPAGFVPRPYDILPAIRTTFHCCDAILGIKNPSPDRIAVMPYDGPPPGQEDSARPATKEEVSELVAHMREKLGGIGRMPEENNGRTKGGAK